MDRFNRQLDENMKVTQIFKEATKIITFYKNITENVYFITTKKTNSGSSSATSTISLIRADGEQVTTTEFSKRLKNVLTELESKNSTIAETSSFRSLFSDFFDFIDILSVELEFLFSTHPQKLDTYSISDVLRMSVLNSTTFEGELVAQSFSQDDMVFCFVHVTSSATYLSYFDLNDFTMSSYSNYTFPDNSFVTSLT